MAIKIAGTEVINDNRELVLAKLTEINTSIADTAVDIFVYDTRKDSDGGQWRHRCQHTSWYNETLNTATRGSRKEFPAVAVIVAEADQVTIYDGDDPDLPMWMVFNGNYDADLQGNKMLVWSQVGNDITCSPMLNAKMSVGIGNTGGGVILIDFISELTRYYRDSSSSFTGAIYSGTIADRDTQGTYSYIGDNDNFAIVDQTVNDVAMTVLPNAPIDASTGLPVPTIAVATDGGTSVITDSGAVYDITGFSPVENVNFYGDRLAINTPVGSTSYINVGSAILNSDTTSGAWEELEINSSTINDLKILPNQAAHQAFDDTYYSAGSGGLLSVKPDYAAPETCLHAFTTSSYNTGWMNGDIKLATLSDTDATNVTGSELVTNGTFDTDTSGWSFDRNDGTTTASVSSGQLTLNRGSDSNSVDQFLQNITLEVGKKYTFTIKRVSGSVAFAIVGTNLGPTIVGGGTYLSYTITADSTSGTLQLWALSQNSSVTIDDISVRLAEEDRSVNGNGLQVFGTVTKSAVATGADLMRYDGWSGSNYLQQPYNSDLDFGTGDFCYMLWFANGTDYYDNNLLHRAGGSLTAGGLLFQSIGSYTLNIWNKPNNVGFTGSYQVLTYPAGVWNHLVYTRRGSVAYVYLNGELKTSATDTTNMDLPDAKLRIGGRHDNTTNYFRGDLALLRASATAPSPEQIKKIYEDEKVLFQENAKATLYGTSDAVTALAYDDSTELLHVGTSAGRSVFQGLRRVDNTTTAVGAAISASNSMVAED